MSLFEVLAAIEEIALEGVLSEKEIHRLAKIKLRRRHAEKED